MMQDRFGLFHRAHEPLHALQVLSRVPQQRLKLARRVVITERSHDARIAESFHIAAKGNHIETSKTLHNNATSTSDLISLFHGYRTWR
jgi:hypothetical protein